MDIAFVDPCSAAGGLTVSAAASLSPLPCDGLLRHQVAPCAANVQSAFAPTDPLCAVKRYTCEWSDGTGWHACNSAPAPGGASFNADTGLMEFSATDPVQRPVGDYPFRFSAVAGTADDIVSSFALATITVKCAIITDFKWEPPLANTIVKVPRRDYLPAWTYSATLDPLLPSTQAKAHNQPAGCQD